LKFCACCIRASNTRDAAVHRLFALLIASTWKPQLDAPEWAAMGCADKAKRCGSRCARAHLDSAKKASLWLDCSLQGDDAASSCAQGEAAPLACASAAQSGAVRCHL